MQTQILHHAKIQSSKNPLKEAKLLQDIKEIHKVDLSLTLSNFWTIH
jgi:hypothetical protein